MISIQQQFDEIRRTYEQKSQAWVERLRVNGYKMAMPNDGWVDRKNLTLWLAYPHFCDNLKVGDEAVLGWHNSPQWTKAIKITGKKKDVLGSDKWMFEYLDRNIAELQ